MLSSRAAAATALRSSAAPRAFAAAARRRPAGSVYRCAGLLQQRPCNNPGAGSRSVVHLPFVAWGASKAAAVLGAVAAKAKLGPAVWKGLEKMGLQASVSSIKDLNDKLLQSGIHSQQVHRSVADSLSSLEASLAAVGQSEQWRLMQNWLVDLEKKSPELFVAIVRAYVDSLPAAKLARNVANSFPEPEKEIAGRKREEWERRIHDAFPELKGYSVELKEKK
eukprot:TRINITY_DN26605_c0_g1_i1.p1 TRINITY_DN26605_c0_g1~~TRINITY_DN26605_c0_g1_i1.p1  ORF type:complete len:222 (+),score=54.34 TRINITY_DN26605_c0_g1_i1:38-703(+)